MKPGTGSVPAGRVTSEGVAAGGRVCGGTGSIGRTIPGIGSVPAGRGTSGGGVAGCWAGIALPGERAAILMIAGISRKAGGMITGIRVMPPMGKGIDPGGDFSMSRVYFQAISSRFS